MRRTILTLAALALVATGCGEGDPASDPSLTDVPTTEATSTPAPDEPATEATATSTDAAPEAPFTANTLEDTSEGSGDAVTVADVVVESDEDFDRVTFEIAGDGTPGWRVGYVERAAQQGSGDAVELEGDAQLEVLITNTGYPSDTGQQEYGGPERIDGAEVVTEVAFEGTFEGQTQAFIGTASEQSFRSRLDDDGNVVVEVWHADVVG